jgi:regulator of sigma E protease
MEKLLEHLYVVLAVVLLFGATIFVHEFGHFIVALWRGMRVEAFAIGFGPRIWAATRNGIEYSLRWIPAGGFVKLPQMITSDALEGASDSGEPIPPAPPASKILVAIAGPLMNIIFAFVVAAIIYVVGLPVLVNPSIIGHVDPGSEEYAKGIREGDRIVEVSGRKVTTWQDVHETTILARGSEMPVVIERDGVRTTYQLETRVNEVLGLKMLNLDPRDHPEILEVMEGGAGQEAGLQAGDVVVSFAGVPIASHDQFIDLIKSRPGESNALVVKRDGEEVTLGITPKRLPDGEGRIGVILGSASVPVYEVMQPGPTPWAQVAGVWDKTIRTLSALVHSKETGVGAKDLSGPVGILAMLGAWVKTDYRLALSFLVLLNVNLAILNLLPIPVLDGGHVVMALLEKVRGRPLSQRLVEVVTTACALLLIGFMAYVSFYDVFERMSLFRALYTTDSEIEQVSDPTPPDSLPKAPAPDE